MQITLSRQRLFAFLSMAVISPLLKGLPEQRLVRAAKALDHDAFRRLMETHAPSLRRFIARRVNESEREDVMQETWLAAWESLPAFDAGKSFRPWLFSVCFHKIQDHWRRLRSHPSHADIDEAEHLTAYLPREFSRIEVREAMRRFWEGCSEEQQEMLRMHYSDGLTLPEISVILNRNLNTVKYHFYEIHAMATRKLPDSKDLLHAITVER